MRKTIKLDNNFLTEKADTNEVKIVFGKGETDGRPQTLLILKSGIKGMLKYNAKIKYAGRDDFQSTDVNLLINNVKSTEMWQNEIIEIIISDFSKGTF